MRKKARFREVEQDAPVIHPTAVIHARAKIGPECRIGPYCVIGEDVTMGRACKLHSHVVIGGRTKLGKRNEFFPFTSIGLQTQDLKWKGGHTYTVIGDFNTFREGVTIHSATGEDETTTVGSHNELLAYCHIAHNVKLGSHIIMSNLGMLAGHVTVEDLVVVGGMGGVHQFCRVGKMSMIGGFSKVVQDVAPYMIVDGNPAVTRTINKVGLERNGVSEKAQTALRHAFKLLFKERLTTPNALKRIEEELPDLAEIRHLVGFIRASVRGITK